MPSVAHKSLQMIILIISPWIHIYIHSVNHSANNNNFAYRKGESISKIIIFFIQIYDLFVWIWSHLENNNFLKANIEHIWYEVIACLKQD